MTKFAPHKALISIARVKLTFDERIEIYRVGAEGKNGGLTLPPRKVDMRLPGKGNQTSMARKAGPLKYR